MYSKFVYPVCHATGHNEVRTVVAVGLNEAKDKVARYFFDNYSELTSDEFDSVQSDLWLLYHIAVGEPIDVENV